MHPYSVCILKQRCCRAHFRNDCCFCHCRALSVSAVSNQSYTLLTL